MNNQPKTASIAIDELGKIMGGTAIIGPKKPIIITTTPPYNPFPNPTSYPLPTKILTFSF